MADPIRVLLQTTIPPIEDDWHIGRFSAPRDHLESLTDEKGEAAFEVTARPTRFSRISMLPPSMRYGCSRSIRGTV
jgi:hypothetical protein